MKIEIVAPVEGKKWPIGHTVLVDDQSGQQLIDEGVAIIHPATSTCDDVKSKQETTVTALGVNMKSNAGSQNTLTRNTPMCYGVRRRVVQGHP